MAFTTFSLADKISLLQQLEKRSVLGAVKSQGSGERVATEFTADTAHLMNQIEQLKDAIRADPGFDNNNPLWDALTRDRRHSITRTRFMSDINGAPQGNFPAS